MKETIIWHILALVVRPAVVAVVAALTVAGVVSPAAVRDLCVAIIAQVDSGSRPSSSSSGSIRLPESRAYSSPESPAP